MPESNSYIKKCDIPPFQSAKFVLMTSKVEGVSNEKRGDPAREAAVCRTEMEGW